MKTRTNLHPKEAEGIITAIMEAQDAKIWKRITQKKRFHALIWGFLCCLSSFCNKYVK
jgi:hypothetical protein